MNLTVTAIRGSESWQFFAFVFAAVATLGLSLADNVVVLALGRENPAVAARWAIIAKFIYFALSA